MPELLTVPEAADLLRTSPKALYSRIERGQVPGVRRLGKKIYISASILRKAMGLLPSPEPSLASTPGSSQDP